MVFKSRSFKKGYLNLDGVKETECLESLTKSELKILIREFTNDKEFYFHSYLQCIEGGREIELLGIKDEVMAILQRYCWEEHLYFDRMVEWCEKELEKRR